MADKLEGSRLKKGVPYPVARVGGPREVSDTLAVGEGVEFFSGVGFSTLPEVPHSSIESKRSGDANTGSCREGDPCSNKFLFSVYEGASLLLLAEGKPLGAPAATEAACAAVVGFSRCFTRFAGHPFSAASSSPPPPALPHDSIAHRMQGICPRRNRCRRAAPPEPLHHGRARGVHQEQLALLGGPHRRFAPPPLPSPHPLPRQLCLTAPSSRRSSPATAP